MQIFLNQLSLNFSRLGFVGLSPYAPGTCGSFVAILLAPFSFLAFSLPTQLIILTIIFIVGGLAATRAERCLEEKDPGSIVIDELLGQWVCLLAISQFELNSSELINALIVAFGLFRFFDILKPFPIRRSENWLKGGFGVMIDDLIAGIYAAIILWLIIYYFFPN